MTKKIITYLFLAFFAMACKNVSRQTTNNALPTDTLQTKYARFFSVRYFENYKEIAIRNKWSNDTTFFYLTQKESTQTPAKGQKIALPLKNIATTSSTHIGFLDAIDEITNIKSIASPELIYNESVRKRIKNHEITDIGDAFNPNIEKTVFQNPDALFISDFKGGNPIAKKLTELGVPVIFINEWQENSPLARAEWIKLLGALFNKEFIADSIFNEAEKKYLQIKKSQTAQHTSVLSGNCFQEIWNIPGGESYMGTFFKNAGFDYLYKNDSSSGSIGMNFERIYKEFHDADVWIGCPTNTIDEIIEIDDRYSLFKAVKNKQVYNFNNRKNNTGGNDYWETGVVRPDLILQDFSNIANQNGKPLYFLKKLE